MRLCLVKLYVVVDAQVANEIRHQSYEVFRTTKSHLSGKVCIKRTYFQKLEVKRTGNK